MTFDSVYPVCVLQQGEVRCVSRESECPVSRCTHPIRSLTQCCPLCDGCTFMRRHFRSGQKFVPPGDDNCRICRCVVSLSLYVNYGITPLLLVKRFVLNPTLRLYRY